MPGDREVDRAIKCSYAQAMLWSVFAASTGGMFLTGFAMKLGAGDFMLGLMTTLPQLLIIFQFPGALLVERGISRKKLALGFGLVAPLCWFLIAAIPFIGTEYARSHLGFITPANLKTLQFSILIGTLALVTGTSQLSNSARGSWLGELVPEDRRGSFFGKSAMYWMIVFAGFTIVEGKFIDKIRNMDLFAFTGLFFFGTLFGLVSVMLTLPQADCPLPSDESRRSMMEIARRTIRNRPFVKLALVHVCWSMTSVAGPFFPAYMIRDVGVSYFGLGVINSFWHVAFLAASPVAGKLVNRFGCKPIMTLGFLTWAPCTLVWLAVPPGMPERAWHFLPVVNIVAGFAAAAVNVAVSTMIYKTSKPVGRSVQFALYNTFVVLCGAPMPLLGGWAVSKLQAAGHAVDLRLTFFCSQAFVLLAAYRSTKTKEPDAVKARSLAFHYFPTRLAAAFNINLQELPYYPAFLRRFNIPVTTPRDEGKSAAQRRKP